MRTNFAIVHPPRRFRVSRMDVLLMLAGIALAKGITYLAEVLS